MNRQSTRHPHRPDQGVTVLELVLALGLFGLVAGAVFGSVDLMGRQSRQAFHATAQTRAALMLLEQLRVELSSMVLNPFQDARYHEGNSFIISRPYGTSIQFVMEKRNGPERERFLVYYEARDMDPEDPGNGLVLRKRVWEFHPRTPWVEAIDPRTSWPADWIGACVTDDTSSFQDLDLQDIRWQYLVPEENEGRVFFRVKLVLRSAQGRTFLPFSTLVGLQTPDPPSQVSDCPCLLSPMYDPADPDCGACLEGSET